MGESEEEEAGPWGDGGSLRGGLDGSDSAQRRRPVHPRREGTGKVDGKGRTRKLRRDPVVSEPKGGGKAGRGRTQRLRIHSVVSEQNS